MSMLLALLATAQAASTPAPGPVRTFSDWVVGCDNGRRCTAIGLHPEGTDFERDRPAILIIEREAGPSGAIILSMDGYQGDAPVRLRLDDAPVAAAIGSGEADSVIVPTDRAAFLESLRNGRRLEALAADGGRVATFSLRGLSAAMLAMDEAQGRLGTTTALVRRGSRPASAVPAAPTLPVVRLAPATSERPIALSPARIAQLRRQQNCTIDEVGGPDEVETAALGGGATLVLLACGAGAYNVSSVPLIARRQGRAIRIDPAPFEVSLAQGEEGGPQSLINAAYDPATGLLEQFAKARGLGDCGSRASYGWDGTRFRLVHQQDMPECRGSITYVTTWRARTRR